MLESRQQQSGDGSSRREGREEPSLESLWREYLKGGYFGLDGNLKDEYVSRRTVEPLVKAMARDGHPPLSMSQARRFFHHARAIESRLKADTATWESLRAEFKKLDVAAADAFGKREAKIPKLFHDFIQRNVLAVATKKDFLKGFIPHFEAVMGFGAAHLREERSRG